MKSIFIEILFILGIFERCLALPIGGSTTGNSFGENNKYFLGGLIFISIGAVFGACICCKRRKKGFEEFQNESGTLESNRTEYPIFRALSPESQRNVLISNARAAADNDNLIEQDFDNNNGPISPADLENIENNNAVDYIQNQNEVSVVIEHTPYSCNRNLMSPQSNIIQDLAISSTTPDPNPRAEGQNSQDDAVSSSDVVIMCEEEPVIPIKAINQCLSENPMNYLPRSEIIDMTSNIKTVSHLSNVPIYSVLSEREIVSNIEKEINQFISQPAIGNDNFECNVIVEANIKDTLSVKSNSSGKSSDINSVEEALRALDSAIAVGELANVNCSDDDNDLDDEYNCESYDYDDDDENEDSDSSETNRKNLHNVIRQLLTNNGANNFLPELNMKFVSSYDKFHENDATQIADKDLEEHIRKEAILLVDSILKEGGKIVNEINSSQSNENPNESKTLKESHDDDDICVAEKIEENFCTKNNTIIIITPSNDCCSDIEKTEENPEPELSPLESDFANMAMETSTPCLQNKFSNRIHSDEQRKRVQMLFDDLAEDILESTVTIETEAATTFVKPVINTTIINIEESSPDGDEGNNGTFVLSKADENIRSDETFKMEQGVENSENGFVYPGDPCTSKQAMERDYGFLAVRREREEMNSDDMNTITPVNTPIELTYPQDTWNKIMSKSDEGCEANSGWFLHPQAHVETNETFEVEDEGNLESTFEALRKQLAEVLPQPQNITGPPDFSDDEEQQEQMSNRTFDEYRSPLDGLIGLLENEPSTSNVIQNELFINYKRPLSPIIEESEEETCRTFVMNETKCLDSTSTGFADTGEAIMGVSKNLMASNDTLFNFEDTLGEREDAFSPRTPSRSDTNPNTPVKSGISTEENSIETNDSGSKTSENLQNLNDDDDDEDQPSIVVKEKRIPPTTISFMTDNSSKQESDLCSPEQQKTFSEGTSSTGEQGSSDLSATVGPDNTFTTNTIDEKTCITVILKDDERISEISEPEWGSTASYGGYDMNSLSDVPSMDFLNDIEERTNENDENNSQRSQINETVIMNDNFESDVSLECDDEVNNCQNNSEECRGNTELSSGNTTDKEDSVIEDKQPKSLPTNDESLQTVSSSDGKPNDVECNFKNTIHKNDIVNVLLNDHDTDTTKMHINSNTRNSIDSDGSKENKDPNIKISSNKTIANSDYDINTSYQKVQNNSQDAVINDKIRNISSHFVDGDIANGLHENVIHQQELAILPVKYQQTINNYSVSDVNGIQNGDENCLMMTDELVGQLSGEEDPWAEQLTDIRFIGPCSEVISTSFTANEWDSDVDDSHSSEEFMYVRGPAQNATVDEKSKSFDNTNSEHHENMQISSEDEFESHVWSSHDDKVPIENTLEDETSEESSSEFEGEFVPSCWDSMAMPARSALKSPDKSSSESKKRRSVAFKKQSYHSVYEYPRENCSLSPAYSEPFLWNKNSNNLTSPSGNEITAEFNDGFAVSSTMRPFHGSQFNALCHTWPTNSDFSWSQVEELNLIEDKKLATYSNIDVKWPSRESSTDDSSELKTYNKTDESLRPDSGVSESADTISERLLLGELRHTKATLRLPLDVISPNELLPELKAENNVENDLFNETTVLPTPSCTGSMDSLSSSSSSERQISFSTFGKRNNLTNDIDRKTVKDNLESSILRPSLILIENDSIESQIAEKIKQGDSTDEDSGIESIMKINKDND